MAAFIFDGSVETDVIAHLVERGHDCTTDKRDAQAIVELAATQSRVIVTRKTDYPALLEALGSACPCLIWVGPLPGHPTIATQLDLLLGGDPNNLQPGQIVMMMPGRNQILKVG
jgi:hypothetical protein